jgi:hypothetical protein
MLYYQEGMFNTDLLPHLLILFERERKSDRLLQSHRQPLILLFGHRVV